MEQQELFPDQATIGTATETSGYLTHAHGVVCPHCGRCPTCGRGNYTWPQWPTQPYITWNST